MLHIQPNLHGYCARNSLQNLLAVLINSYQYDSGYMQCCLLMRWLMQLETTNQQCQAALAEKATCIQHLKASSEHEQQMLQAQLAAANDCMQTLQSSSDSLGKLL